MMRTVRLTTIVAFVTLVCLRSHAQEKWVVYEGTEGPGLGVSLVFMAGDEEYRSEESLPMLAQILAQRHGFTCTVLFSQDADGTINPNESANIPGLHLLADADLAVCQFRFRALADEDMKHFVDYATSGKPMIAIRTATHAFNYADGTESQYAHYSYNSREWPGGFGQQVLGETWINHHGRHGSESTRGVIDGIQSRHPVLRGVRDVWGPTDVYGIRNLRPSDTVLMHGLTLSGMSPLDPPNYNKALMPIVWVRDYTWETGIVSRTLTSTIGAATDLQNEDLRRMFVNACYWLTGLDPPEEANVEYIGDYEPSDFGFDKFKQGINVIDHKLEK